MPSILALGMPNFSDLGYPQIEGIPRFSLGYPSAPSGQIRQIAWAPPGGGVDFAGPRSKNNWEHWEHWEQIEGFPRFSDEGFPQIEGTPRFLTWDALKSRESLVFSLGMSSLGIPTWQSQLGSPSLGIPQFFGRSIPQEIPDVAVTRSHRELTLLIQFSPNEIQE